MLSVQSRLRVDDPNWRRINITIGCHDSEYIPKVPGAGQVFESETQPYQVMHNDVKVIMGGYHSLWMAEIIRALNGHHEPQEEKAFYEILKHIPPKAVMIELGAFWAYYSMWFQKIIPGAVNYMVEPDPNSLAVGETNFTLNKMNGTFINACVGQTPGHNAHFLCESDGVTRDITKLSVDSLIETYQIQKIDMLHADIQGVELEMLQGCIQSIAAQKIRFVFLSTHHHSISHDPIIHYNCLDFLRNHNAHIIASHTVNESYSGDGLIVASFLDDDKEIPTITLSKNVAAGNLFRETEFDLYDLQLKYESAQEGFRAIASIRQWIAQPTNYEFITQLRIFRQWKMKLLSYNYNIPGARLVIRIALRIKFLRLKFGTQNAISDLADIIDNFSGSSGKTLTEDVNQTASTE